MKLLCPECSKNDFNYASIFVGTEGINIYVDCRFCLKKLRVSYRRDGSTEVRDFLNDDIVFIFSDRLISWGEGVDRQILLRDWSYSRSCNYYLEVSLDGSIVAYDVNEPVKKYNSWKHAREEFPKLIEKSKVKNEQE